MRSGISVPDRDAGCCGEKKITLAVVRGSGTGELSGLRGSATIAVGHEQLYGMALEYDFEG